MFLDFDGVLNDLATIEKITSLGGFFVKFFDKNTFNKHSIQALNYIMCTFECNYDCELVLSTSWRRNFHKAINILYGNGFQFRGNIHRTQMSLFRSRDKEINEFLQAHDCKDNYLIIDDLKCIPKNFPEGKYIHTNLKDSCLNMSQVIDFIDKYYPELKDNVPLENFEDDITVDDFEADK